MRQMPRLVQDMNAKACGQRFGVIHRNDPVIAAPDDLDWQPKLGNRASQIDRLTTSGKPSLSDCCQRRCHTIEPLVAQYILDHCTADQCRVVDQKMQHLECLSTTRGAHK